MKQVFVLLVCALILVGCSNDPLGMTSREQARSAAQQSQWDSEARQAEAEAAAIRAQAEAQARAAEAQAKAEVEKTQIEAWSDALRKVEDASKRNLGVVYLLIVAIVGLSGTAIYWMGRTNTVMAAQHAPQRPLLSVEQQIALLAQREGLYAQFDGQRWLLVDSEGVVRKQQKLLTVRSES